MGVVASSDICAMVPKEVKNEALTRKFSLPEVIDNDVEEGEKLGNVEFLLDDKLISSTDLLAAQEIKTNRIYKGFYILKQKYIINYFGLFYSNYWIYLYYS